MATTNLSSHTPESARLLAAHLTGAAGGGDPLNREFKLEKQRMKQREKLQSAWISFVGRIVAQMMGAAATIGLGLYVVHSQLSSSQVPQAPGAGQVTIAAPVRPAGSEPSIAVLPLEDFSTAGSQGEFVNGMTEALIADLAQADGLRVISRTSVMPYRDQKKSLPAIAAELGADLVVEGSIVRDGDRLRVTTQLIDARTDEHLWARTYDRTMGDVLGVQKEVAAAIAQDVAGVVAREHHAANTAARPGLRRTQPVS